MSFTRIYFLLFLILLLNQHIEAQCISVTGATPYAENFELSNGGWTSGGTNNDWAWGSPSKTMINSAGGGTKCWIVGGLNGGSYLGSERSFVRSPCFDFSGLQHPRIRFKLFWESEKNYDGGSLQASTNGGSTWFVVGSNLDTTDCETENWYNSNYINNLNGLSYPQMGWSGNVQTTSGICLGGNGSGAWLTAKHCLNGLGGKSNVLLRFTFGSGTSCNDFDGIAFDEIVIDESPVSTPDFNYQCMGGKGFQFTNNSTCKGDILWSFNDPASGSIQQSVIDNPSYTFIGTAPYSVQLQITNACGVSSTITKNIVALSYTVTQTNVSCFGKKDGTIGLQMNSGTAPFSFQWNTNPLLTSPSIANQDTGTYIVHIADAKNCETSDTFQLNYLPPISDSFSVRVETCSEANGSITVQTSGGTTPYTYNWSNGATGSAISGLAATTFQLTTTDAKGCKDTSTIVLAGTTSVPATLVELNKIKCFGDSTGTLQTIPLAGTAPFSYQWAGSLITSDIVNSLKAGTYQVTITDKNNCSGTALYSLSSPAVLQVTSNTTRAFCEQPVGTITALGIGGTTPYSYQWANGETTPNITGLDKGTFSLTVSDVNQCTIVDSTSILSTPALNYSFETINDTCARSTGKISVQPNSGTPPFSFNWNGAFINDSVLTHIAFGTHSAIIKDSVGCMDTLLFTIPLRTKNQEAILDTAFCFERNLFQISPGKFIKYKWENGSEQSSTTIAEAGKYAVWVEDDWGCLLHDTIVVTDLCTPWVSFPTAFSPNGDGVNDIFRPAFKNEFRSYSLQVYNRWGELVFASSNPKNGWDGTYKDSAQPIGVFIYKLAYAFYNQEQKMISGNVTIVR